MQAATSSEFLTRVLLLLLFIFFFENALAVSLYPKMKVQRKICYFLVPTAVCVHTFAFSYS